MATANYVVFFISCLLVYAKAMQHYELPKCAINVEDECANCEELRVCFLNSNGTFSPMFLPCSKLDPRKPFCEQNRCVEWSDACNNIGGAGICYATGVIPNPENCYYYWLCNATGKPAVVEDCGAGFPYDHTVKTCRLGSKCYQFTPDNLCYGKEIQVVTYPNDASIYVRCPPKGFKPVAKKCKGYYKYDFEQNKCDAICTKNDEKIEDNKNCHAYYQCIQISSGKFEKLHHNCPSGFDFNQDKQDCVEGKPGVSCKNKDPTWKY